MGIAGENMKRMARLDDSWNRQDLDGISQIHAPDVVVYWPGRQPTRGMDDHRNEALDFYRTFPDQHVDNRPYKTLFSSDDWTCSIARFRGTMKGPMRGPNGEEIPPTGKSFDVDLCTVAQWDSGRITAEHLFYDLVSFLKQLGLAT